MNEIIEKWKHAIYEKDVTLVETLFTQHPELANHVNDQIFDFDRSAVHCCRENLPLIDLLMDHGADLNLKSGWWAGGFGILEGLSPESAQPLIERGAVVDIWAAVGLNDRAKVRALLEADPTLITAKGGDGKHPLHDAQDVEMVDYLVSQGAHVNARCLDHHSTAAQYQIGNRKVVYRLLDHGTELDVFMAAVLGDVDILRQCLNADPSCSDARLGVGRWTNEAGGDIYNWTIGHDMTPQQVARIHGNEEVLRLLLEHASPTRQLMDAIWIADRKQVDQRLQENEQLLDHLGMDDRRALSRAAWWYEPQAVQLMLELGFDPHVAGIHNSTPLDRAAFHGYADIIEMLLSHDSDPPVHIKNEFGGTPLGACLYGFKHGWETGHPQDHVKSVKLLVDAGSEVEDYQLGMGNQEIEAILQEAKK